MNETCLTNKKPGTMPGLLILFNLDRSVSNPRLLHIALHIAIFQTFKNLVSR